MAVGSQFMSVGTVGHRPDGCAHGPFRSSEDRLGQLLERRLGIVLNELRESGTADPGCADDRLDVTKDHFRYADIGCHHPVELPVPLPALMQFARRNAQPFLEDIPRIEFVEASPDVGHMCRGRHVGDKTRAGKERHDDDQVGQVPVAQPGIVGDQHVAGRERLRRIGGEHGAGRERQGASEGWG